MLTGPHHADRAEPTGFRRRSSEEACLRWVAEMRADTHRRTAFARTDRAPGRRDAGAARRRAATTAATDQCSALAMELSEFLLLFTTAHTLLASDGAAHAGRDPMHVDAAVAGLLLEATPWAPIFFVLCTAALAMCSSMKLSGPAESALWCRLNKPVGVLSPMAGERRWVRWCGMSYAAFVYLVEELRPYLGEIVVVGEELEVEVAVAVVLNRLASGAAPGVVAGVWGVGAAAVEEYTRVVTSVLGCYEKMYSKYVVAPTGERLERIMRRFFEETGVLGIGGAIGGTRVVLEDKPERDGEGEDGVCSVLLQGVCDADHVFWDVCCGVDGGLSDEEHLKTSSLWTRLCENEVMWENVVPVQGRAIRPFLVGSENYPLLPFLMKPLDAGRARTEVEIMFDARLRKGHASIATTFGILKNRWKILKNLNVDLEFATQTIAACCVLHNFCQLCNQLEPKTQVDDALNHNIPELHCEDVMGEETRRVLFLDWLARYHNLA